MSEEQVPQGSIPPKVSPFSKPEGAAPITPAAPGAPRPITVRLKPAASAAAVPAAPAPKAPAAPTATPLAASPRLTARVPIPEFPPTQASVPIRPATAHVPDVTAGSAPAPAAGPAPTVKLRPVGQAVSSGTGPTPPAAPVMTPIAASPLTPVHPPMPGSHPLPGGPKPPSGAQVQAAKSKTSRISLDSAIGVAPMTPMGGEKAEPKTIRLKRPADLAAAPSPKVSTAPIRQTSRIPDSVLPTPEAAAAEAASVTQKKTLKIKRPGASAEGGAAPALEGGEAAGTEGIQMTPISPFDIPSAQEEPKVFTGIAAVVAAAAAVVMVLLTLCLGAHAAGTVANPNTTASISGFEIPWPGRIAD